MRGVSALETAVAELVDAGSGRLEAARGRGMGYSMP
jgi:hypothetical protein